MKKKISLIFISTLVLSFVFTGCASKSASPAPSSDATEVAGSDKYETSEPAMDSGEQYLHIDENTEKLTENDSMLTFSLKVDTAAYNNVERYIESGNIPPKDAVKIEEMINYFSYDEEMIFGEDPFSIYTELGKSPFDSEKYLAFIRVKSEDIEKDVLPSSNLTFLIDTSGSMDTYDKLPLLKEAFGLLVETLDEDDRVSIVTYAGSSAIVLDSATGADKDRILKAINNLNAGGSTAGADGIQTAYKLSEKNYIEGGNNRIILATDGDFNVGISSTEGLKDLVSEKKDKGVFLSILGFGTGNIRDDIMETLAKHGNGNHSYINNLSSAQKVLVDELSSNLFVIGEDVKAQVEFNPANVTSYRLIGYENRQLDNKDFDDDTKDSGEIGVGTDVVIMFELTLNDGNSGLKYKDTQSEPLDYADELFEVRIRYKNPGEEESNLMIQPVTFGELKDFNTNDYNFAASVMGFGHILRDSSYGNSIDIEEVIHLAMDSVGKDEKGYRKKYIELLRTYETIK